MVLTDIVIKNLPRSCRSSVVLKYFEKDDVNGQWQKTATAKKLNQRKVRANLTDFDRFKIRAEKIATKIAAK